MKRYYSVFITLLLGVIISLPTLAQDINVEIDQIIQGKHISGYIKGISPQQSKDHKVVIYVLTDKWYIHPYADGGEERSWASINELGAWKIQTVKRAFSAKKLAALLVPKKMSMPNRTETIEAIEASAIDLKNLEGTEDYGKL